MMILIKDKEFFCQYKPWQDAMNAMRGQWVEVETEHLFRNQFNVATARVMACDIDGVKDDVRPFRKKCNWCGLHSAHVVKKCPNCGKDSFMRLTHKKEKKLKHSLGEITFRESVSEDEIHGVT